MKPLLPLLAFLLLTQAAVAAEPIPQPTVFADLVEYRDGILKVEMDTCGGQVQPIVEFKAAEEIVTSDLIYGAYLVKIRPSETRGPHQLCPLMPADRFEFNLKALFKEWVASGRATENAKIIMAKNGQLEIVVMNFTTSINFKTSAQ
jgi:hypothetical protein